MISIIIPTFNEAGHIEELLSFLNENTQNVDTEIIIVDGGSRDNTVSIARAQGVRLLKAPQQGRAAQMNYGARNARGGILYFLHADTFPPKSFITDIITSLDRGYDCGCFRLMFNSSHPMLRLYSWFTKFDIDYFRFGDQSLFVRKHIFKKTGFFDEQLLVMEDQEMVRKLKGEVPFIINNKAVVTSARKYKKIGAFKLQFIFTIIVILYYFNVEQKTIAHFYKETLKGSAY
ncbi:MAG: glycosyltransferase [Balneolaceae bacterium]|nr:glycosyltransferase [Balneolaceae bacterium]